MPRKCFSHRYLMLGLCSTLFILFMVIATSCQPQSSGTSPVFTVGSEDDGQDTTDSGGIVVDTNPGSGDDPVTVVEPDPENGLENNPPLADPPTVLSKEAAAVPADDNCAQMCAEFNLLQNTNVQVSEECLESVKDQCEQNACVEYQAKNVPRAITNFAVPGEYVIEEGIELDFCHGGFVTLRIINGVMSFIPFNVGRLPVLDFNEFTNDDGETVCGEIQFIDHLPRNGVPQSPDVGRGEDCTEEFQNTAVLRQPDKSKKHYWSMPATLDYDLRNFIGPDKFDPTKPVYVQITGVGGVGIIRITYHWNNPNTDPMDPNSGMSPDVVVDNMWWIDPNAVVTMKVFYAEKPEDSVNID